MNNRGEFNTDLQMQLKTLWFVSPADKFHFQNYFDFISLNAHDCGELLICVRDEDLDSQKSRDLNRLLLTVTKMVDAMASAMVENNCEYKIVPCSKILQHSGTCIVDFNKCRKVVDDLKTIYTALTIKYSEVDVVFANSDDRQVVDTANNLLEKIGCKTTRVEELPLVKNVCDLTLLTTRSEIRQLVDACDKRQLRHMLRLAIFPVLNATGRHFTVFRRDIDGGKLEFSDYKTCHKEWIKTTEKISAAISHVLDLVVEDIRKTICGGY